MDLISLNGAYCTNLVLLVQVNTEKIYRFQAVIQVASEPTPTGFIAAHYMQSHRKVFDFFSSDVMETRWRNMGESTAALQDNELLLLSTSL